MMLIGLIQCVLPISLLEVVRNGFKVEVVTPTAIAAVAVVASLVSFPIGTFSLGSEKVFAVQLAPKTGNVPLAKVFAQFLHLFKL